MLKVERNHVTTQGEPELLLAEWTALTAALHQGISERTNDEFANQMFVKGLMIATAMAGSEGTIMNAEDVKDE